MENIIVGITGASGVIYAQRLLKILCKKEYNIHLILSDAAIQIIKHELGVNLQGNKQNLNEFIGCSSDTIIYHSNTDIGTTIASSRYPVKMMIIIPCSMHTLCSVAHGISSNLIQRAASVTLKEGRKLILVPRETPLSSIHLDAMLKLSMMGTCILPAMPGFYHNPRTLDDQIDFVVAKILDIMGIHHCLIPEWQGEELFHTEDL